MILPAQRSSATLAISRLGQTCSILEPVGGSTNEYGKTEGQTWQTVTDESVVRFYQGGGEPSSGQHTGGRLPADSPTLALRADTVVKSGYRIEYGDETYEIDALTKYPSHFEATTTLVN